MSKSVKSSKSLERHIRQVERKIKRFKRKSRRTAGLEKELAYATGKTDRPAFRTGPAARAAGERKRAAKVAAPQES